MPTTCIRLATQSDADELARLRWDSSTDEVAASGQSFGDFRQGFEEYLQQALESGNWNIWVAELDGRLIANIYVQLVHKVPKPGRFGSQRGNRYGYVTNVYAEPDVRGQGVGSELLKRIAEWARAQELDFLVLWPSEESVRFYERAGFVHSPDALELHFQE
jgi:GNAT superfamily N-acetyltransferase